MPLRKGLDKWDSSPHHSPWTEPCIFCGTTLIQDRGHSWCPQCGLCIVCGLEPEELDPPVVLPEEPSMSP